MSNKDQNSDRLKPLHIPLPLDEALRDAMNTPAPEDDDSQEKSSERKPISDKKQRKKPK